MGDQNQREKILQARKNASHCTKFLSDNLIGEFVAC